MHRFYIPSSRCRGDRMVLGEGESHHATRVLRVESGDSVEVLDGMGRQYSCRVIEARKSVVTLTVVSERSTPKPSFNVTLVAGIPKGQLFDDMVEQAVELRVSRIIPLVTERGNVRFDPASGRAKQEKWQICAIEAIKQCGSLWLPDVQLPTSFKQCLDRIKPQEVAIVGSLHSGTVEVGQVLDEARDRKACAVSIWLGPEGDFTVTEMQQLIARGAKPVTLGPLVLRCATAALSLLSVVTHDLRRKPLPL